MALGSKALIYKRVLLFSLLPLSFISLMYLLLQQPVMIDLSDNNQAEVASLKSSWENGEVIAVIHHLESCDGVDVQCWNTENKNGITKRSLGTGFALAEDLQILGLHKADIYYSPQQRTEETSQVLFGYEGVADESLAKCNADNPLLNATMKNKRAETNLIFVVDGDCIAEFQKSLGSTRDTRDNATVLFAINRSLGSKPRLLGFVNAEDWQSTFGW
jgi:hypothetical protein